jgi:hypothetical protein
MLRFTIAMAALLTGLLFARHALATTFQSYDDEGYLLLSVDHYMKGGPLYTEVFSQYGPFYFYAQGALFRLLRLPVSHDAGRLVTLICWLLSAVLAGYFIYQVTNDIVLASGAFLACTKLASVLANEPGHPQQVILPMLMLACCASAPRGHGRLGMLLSGALGAALFFTKINVGVFYFAALALILVCSFPFSRIRTIGVGLLLAYAVGVPLLLMRQDLLGWARNYCLLAILCGVCTFVGVSLTMPPSPQPMRNLLDAVTGALSTAALVVIGTRLQGMSSATLMEGVFWAPLRHPKVFSIHFEIATWTVIGATMVSGCIAALYLFRDPWMDSCADWVDALRCAVGVCTVLRLQYQLDVVAWALPFLPLGMMPVKGRVWRPSDLVPRLFVAGLAATQFLQAYPVAGSQLGIAASPMLLWAFVCIHDGAGGLLRLTCRAMGLRGDALPKESIIGGLVALAIAVNMFRSGSLSWRYPYPPSRLRGAASLHLPADVEDRYLFLASRISANCDFLFTLPGMGSLNFWSGVPTPNGSNMTAWMRGFSSERQQQILGILRANLRGCAVYNAGMSSLWRETSEELDALPLARYIIHDMPKAAERDGYEIRIHPRRNSPWVEIAMQPSRMP